MQINRSKGFTLIELLVVIAIIGVLSAVVLASLNTARTKGNDAAIQSNLSTVQTQAEIYYGGTGANTYGALFTAANCPTAAGTMFYDDITIRNAIAATNAANGSPTPQCVATGTGTANAYAVLSALSSSGTTYWCTDSTGFAGQRTTATFVGGACPAT